MTTVVALLPMKGHSERVAGKNLRPMLGRPLYHWIMDALIATPEVAQVVVDTDSDAIADDVANSFAGVTVRRRPDDLVGDMVSMHDIVARFVAETELDVVLQTHATNPLLRSETLSEAIGAFREQNTYDSLLSVTEWHARLYDADHRPINHDPNVLLRTQDLAPIYEENSGIYIAPRRVVERTGHRIGDKPLLFTIDRVESLDIDEELDFAMVECLLERRRHGV